MKGHESIIGEYLSANGWQVDYERRVGESNPDFSLWDGDEPVAVWEVTERSLSEEDRQELARRESQMRSEGMASSTPANGRGFTIHKIRSKARQITKLGPVPAMLVLVDPYHLCDLSATTILYAVSGWPTHEVKFGPQGGLSPGFHGDDGRMVDSRFAAANQVFSAVATPRIVMPDQHRSGFLARIDEVSKGVSSIDESGKLKLEFTNAFYEGCAAAKRDARRRGYKLNRSERALDIVLNARANAPWPMHLVGKFDRVVQAGRNPYRPTVIYDGLRLDQGLLDLV